MLVLIDLSTSHNFIDDGFMEHKGLKTKDSKGFQFSNANGKLILVNHIVEHFGVQLQSCVVQEDFYLYPF